MGRTATCAPTVMLVNTSLVSSSVRRLLDLKGYEVLEVDDIVDALDKATDYTLRCRPDLILVALERGSKDEVSVVRVFRDAAMMSDIPVFVIRSDDRADHRAAATAGGSSKFIARADSLNRLQVFLDGFQSNFLA
jgi:CheY-like chemotaxis protein